MNDKNPDKNTNLGKLESEHGIAPAYLQRVVFITVLSFIFFLAMLIAFSIRQNIGYFLLSTAFLIVYLFTMIGWLMQRRSQLRLYENGLRYKKFAASWDEIESIDVRAESRLTGPAKINCRIRKTGGEEVVLTDAVRDLEKIVRRISDEIKKESDSVRIISENIN